ncbi:uncharacterized protein [Eurosta solidaginis]|uniref:uncharacterized protein n=1 Tax=Eurosta solidaginis TaxID=178769 RepID=UPI0035307CEF
MLKLFEIVLVAHIIKTMHLYQWSATASYLSLPNAYNSPTNGLTYAAPLLCDSPPLESYGAATLNHPPLLFSSYPLSYSSAPHFNYAASAPPTFVKYASEPRVKVTHGAPVSTTYTTGVGFAAPPSVQSYSPPVGLLPQFVPLQATFAAPASSYAAGVAYSSPPNFFSTSKYGVANFLSPSVKRFRTPLPVDTYSYAQGTPNGVWQAW